MVIYNSVVSIYGLAIRAAAIRKEKARKWVQGRQNWRFDLQKKINELGDAPRIWFHCASYGEFEQGRPLIELIRQKYPRYKIILSFFSPSGYEAFKNYKGAEVICYLPLDSDRSAKDFINLVKPQQAIFVKYEFWLHFLFELKRQNIPTYLVSATFKAHHPFFKWYGRIFRRSLLSFNKIFLQDENSVSLLKGIGINNVVVAGDTRFDRVIEIMQDFKGFEDIKKFKGDGFLIVAGSTWPKDDDLLLEIFLELAGQNVKMIIAPHELDPGSVLRLKQKIDSKKISCSFYSQGINEKVSLLILDKMGMLSRLYYHGDAAYIGGGFNDGIHNTLEPAVYGMPVFFYGQDFHKYNEAVKMVKLGVAVNILTKEQLSELIRSYIRDKNKRSATRETLKSFFDQNTNVSERILREIDLS